MKYSFLPFLIIFSFFVLFCNSSNNKTPGNKQNDRLPEKGTVIPDVACLNNPSVRYSLYLPADYSAKRRYPLILAFDSHASGNLPVEKYDSLAEYYGYILMGSNNSKNGLPMNETEDIVNSMFSEINTRYSVDSSRIYLMGFSGGARIAALVALYRGGVKGIIGCGAGFPGTNQPGRFRFDYIGFAGNADFNMNEMVNLDEQLEQQGFRHALILFDGKHEWPEIETMEYAFLWNEFCAMKDGKIAENKIKIADFLDLVNQSLHQAEEQNSLYQKKLAMLQVIRFLKGIEPVDHEQKELDKLLSDEKYKAEEKKITALREKEVQEQQMFNENFFLKDLNWWKNKIKNYELRITNDKDQDEVLLLKRIMSYLSLLAYINYTHTTSIGDKEKADFALEVYRIVDPENAAKIK